jgi:hypothetical protein
MEGFYFCFAAILIMYGLILIFRKDTAWKWQKAGNSMRGLKSERTGDWEAYSTITGYVTIGIAICLAGMTLSARQQRLEDEAMLKDWVNELKKDARIEP